MKRFLTVALALLLLLPAIAMATGQAGGAAAKPLKFRVLGPGPGVPPKDDILIRYAQEKNPADVEWMQVVQEQLGDMMYLGLAQKYVAAGNVPEVWALGHYSHYGDAMDYLSKQKFAYEMPAELIRKNMPIYSSRVDGYGLTVETIQNECKYIGDGKNWYVNAEISPSAFPKLFKTNYGQTLGAHQLVYGVYLRDDILKRLYPNARTEAEMKALYLKQDGKLSLNDVIGDLPIKDIDSLTDYMRKVKALNLKVGDKQVIPAAPYCGSGSPGSVNWSIFTILGWTHRWPMIYQEPPAELFWPRITDNYKKYIDYHNMWYHEGLLDPEIFVMKDDQYQAKARNGEYAIINFWLPVADARKVALDQNRGYGWRYCPIFYPLDFSIMNNWFMYDTIPSLSTLFTKSIKEEDLPAVMKWLDWQFSEEADSLQYWGHPTFYTGTGKDRRYKAEYNALKMWTVYGVTGDKDGDYYGMRPATHVLPSKEINYQPKIRCVDLTGGFSSEFAPPFVYERKASEMGDITDMGAICDKVVQDDMQSHQRMFVSIGWNEREWYNMFGSVDDCVGKSDYSGTFIRALTGPRADFEKNWQAFYDLWVKCGALDKQKEINEYFISKWPLIKSSEAK